VSEKPSETAAVCWDCACSNMLYQLHRPTTLVHWQNLSSLTVSVHSVTHCIPVTRCVIG